MCAAMKSHFFLYFFLLLLLLLELIKLMLMVYCNG